MRIALTRVAALAALLLASTAAYADSADGKIVSIDAAKATIKLDDGNTYKLPGEFDVSSLKKGMAIVLSFDEVNGEKMISDMQLPE